MLLRGINAWLKKTRSLTLSLSLSLLKLLSLSKSLLLLQDEEVFSRSLRHSVCVLLVNESSWGSACEMWVLIYASPCTHALSKQILSKMFSVPHAWKTKKSECLTCSYRPHTHVHLRVLASVYRLFSQLGLRSMFHSQPFFFSFLFIYFSQWDLQIWQMLLRKKDSDTLETPRNQPNGLAEKIFTI